MNDDRQLKQLLNIMDISGVVGNQVFNQVELEQLRNENQDLEIRQDLEANHIENDDQKIQLFKQCGELRTKVQILEKKQIEFVEKHRQILDEREKLKGNVIELEKELQQAKKALKQSRIQPLNNSSAKINNTNDLQRMIKELLCKIYQIRGENENIRQRMNELILVYDQQKKNLTVNIENIEKTKNNQIHSLRNKIKLMTEQNDKECSNLKGKQTVAQTQLLKNKQALKRKTQQLYEAKIRQQNFKNKYNSVIQKIQSKKITSFSELKEELQQMSYEQSQIRKTMKATHKNDQSYDIYPRSMSKILTLLQRFQDNIDNIRGKLVFFNTLTFYADQRLDHFAQLNQQEEQNKN